MTDRNPEAIHEAAAGADSRRAGAPATILVADDEEEVRRLMREILEERNYVVLEARNGIEVLETISARSVDLIILDLVMPEQEGIGTLKALRSERPAVKVLAISGAFGGSFLGCAKMLGAHAVLKKPFSCDSLIESVGALMDPVQG